jgi:hypothetical protein
LTIGFAIIALATPGWILAADSDDDAEQGMDMAAMMAAMAEAAAPGEHHEALKALEGIWSAQVRIFGGPEPILARGVIQSEMVLGGRFLESRYKGEMLGQQFLGIGLDGYDNATGKNVAIWLDTMGTMIMRFEGEASDDGKVRTMFGDVDDPVTGETKTVKVVTSILSAHRYTYEAWEKTGDGEYTKTMEIIFSRE